eukprot:1968586-Prymnesium_polylepis.2
MNGVAGSSKKGSTSAAKMSEREVQYYARHRSTIEEALSLAATEAVASIADDPIDAMIDALQRARGARRCAPPEEPPVVVEVPAREVPPPAAPKPDGGQPSKLQVTLQNARDDFARHPRIRTTDAYP